MPKAFRGVLLLLWLRLISISGLTLLFTAVLRDTPHRIGGWFYYLTVWEVLFELAVRITFLALAGAGVGTLVTAAAVPFLARADSRERFAERVTRAAVVVSAFCVFGIVLRILLQSAHVLMVSARMQSVVLACYVVGFAAVLWIPHTRQWLVTSLDQFLTEKAARRTGIGIATAVVLLATAEWALGLPGAAAVQASGTVSRPGPNILLITFDALSAEDMSLYGYRLPTTPRMDAFARKASVFTNFFSSSTFTTASIATIFTGAYPSEHHVYHWQGRLDRANEGRTLPYLLRAGDYATGGSIANPFAYFVNAQIGRQYEILPAPPHDGAGFMRIWDALGFLHQPQPFGSRAAEFEDLDYAWSVTVGDTAAAGNTRSEFPPSAAFAQAKQVLSEMNGRFFLRVHVFAPHDPYLPRPPFLGRFLPSDEMRSAKEQMGFPWTNHYAARYQPLVDKARLRYDEFLAECDAELGKFLDELESAGKLRNTVLILSADHGESFEGGVYTHGNPDQVRPEIHIPLIVHMPGQEQGARIAVTADQTALAPTVLDMAGLPRPAWMRGQSLVPWLGRNNAGQGEGLAFTQHLAGNSIFRPLRNGTVGVIDGAHQCILDLATGKAILHNLNEAQLVGIDHSAEEPALKERLLGAIYTRFPDLPRKAR
jgi:arylsulfatase A-like enzyme